MEEEKLVGNYLSSNYFKFKLRLLEILSVFLRMLESCARSIYY